MTELELLNIIGDGKAEFSRDEFLDLDEIDRDLRRFAELGYLEKIVRAVYPSQTAGRRLMRLDVVGGLTLLGDARRKQLTEATQAFSLPASRPTGSQDRSSRY